MFTALRTFSPDNIRTLFVYAIFLDTATFAVLHTSFFANESSHLFYIGSCNSFILMLLMCIFGVATLSTVALAAVSSYNNIDDKNWQMNENNNNNVGVNGYFNNFRECFVDLLLATLESLFDMDENNKVYKFLMNLVGKEKNERNNNNSSNNRVFVSKFLIDLQSYLLFFPGNFFEILVAKYKSHVDEHILDRIMTTNDGNPPNGRKYFDFRNANIFMLLFVASLFTTIMSLADQYGFVYEPKEFEMSCVLFYFETPTVDSSKSSDSFYVAPVSFFVRNDVEEETSHPVFESVTILSPPSTTITEDEEEEKTIRDENAMNQKEDETKNDDDFDQTKAKSVSSFDSSMHNKTCLIKLKRQQKMFHYLSNQDLRSQYRNYKNSIINKMRKDDDASNNNNNNTSQVAAHLDFLSFYYSRYYFNPNVTKNIFTGESDERTTILQIGIRATKFYLRVLLTILMYVVIWERWTCTFEAFCFVLIVGNEALHDQQATSAHPQYVKKKYSSQQRRILLDVKKSGTETVADFINTHYYGNFLFTVFPQISSLARALISTILVTLLLPLLYSLVLRFSFFQDDKNQKSDEILDRFVKSFALLRPPSEMHLDALVVVLACGAWIVAAKGVTPTKVSVAVGPYILDRCLTTLENWTGNEKINGNNNNKKNSTIVDKCLDGFLLNDSTNNNNNNRESQFSSSSLSIIEWVQIVVTLATCDEHDDRFQKFVKAEAAFLKNNNNNNQALLHYDETTLFHHVRWLRAFDASSIVEFCTILVPPTWCCFVIEPKLGVIFCLAGFLHYFFARVSTPRTPSTSSRPSLFWKDFLKNTNIMCKDMMMSGPEKNTNIQVEANIMNYLTGNIDGIYDESTSSSSVSSASSASSLTKFIWWCLLSFNQYLTQRSQDVKKTGIITRLFFKFILVFVPSTSTIRKVNLAFVLDISPLRSHLKMYPLLSSSSSSGSSSIKCENNIKQQESGSFFKNLAWQTYQIILGGMCFIFTWAPFRTVFIYPLPKFIMQYNLIPRFILEPQDYFSSSLSPNSWIQQFFTSTQHSSREKQDGLSAFCLMNSEYPGIHNFCRSLRENCFVAAGFDNGRDRNLNCASAQQKSRKMSFMIGTEQYQESEHRRHSSARLVEQDFSQILIPLILCKEEKEEATTSNSTQQQQRQLLLSCPSFNRLTSAEQLSLRALNFVLNDATQEQFSVSAAFDILQNPNFHYCVRKSLQYWQSQLCFASPSSSSLSLNQDKYLKLEYFHETKIGRNNNNNNNHGTDLAEILYSRTVGARNRAGIKLSNSKYSPQVVPCATEKEQDEVLFSVSSTTQLRRQNSGDVNPSVIRSELFEKVMNDILQLLCDCLTTIQQPLRYIQSLEQKQDMDGKKSSVQEMSKNIQQLFQTWATLWDFEDPSPIDMIIAREASGQACCLPPIIVEDQQSSSYLRFISGICRKNEIERMTARNQCTKILSFLLIGRTKGAQIVNSSSSVHQCCQLLFVARRCKTQDRVFQSDLQVLDFVNCTIESFIADGSCSNSIDDEQQQQHDYDDDVDDSRVFLPSSPPTKIPITYFVELIHATKINHVLKFFSSSPSSRSTGRLFTDLFLAPIEDRNEFVLQQDQTNNISTTKPLFVVLLNEALDFMHSTLPYPTASHYFHHLNTSRSRETIPRYSLSLNQAAKSFCYVAQMLKRTKYAAPLHPLIPRMIPALLASEWVLLQRFVTERPNIGSEDERKPEFFDPRSSPTPFESDSSPLRNILRAFGDSEIFLRTETCIFLALGLVKVFEALAPLPDEQEFLLRIIISTGGLIEALGILLPDISKSVCDMALERAVTQRGVSVMAAKQIYKDIGKRKVAEHVGDDDDDDDGNDDRCCICLTSLTRNAEANLVRLEACKHVFHLNCAASFLANKNSSHGVLTCPYCRNPVA